MTDFSPVAPPWWDRWPVYIIGGGPSLKGYDLSRLFRRGTVVGVNRSAFEVPCQVLFTLDLHFIRERREAIEAFPGEKVLAVPESYDEPPIPGATYRRRVQGRGLHPDPDAVTNGLNSGWGALHETIKRQARRVYLLGFDLTKTPAEGTHWHGGYPWGTTQPQRYYDRWAARFAELANALPANVTVYNANPASAIECFPFTSYEELGLPRKDNVV